MSYRLTWYINFCAVTAMLLATGKTECHLNVRSSEHIGISHLTGRSVECKPKPSAVSDHLLLHNHDSNFNNFTILCRDNNGFRLLIKESILISKDSPVLNRNIASIPLLLSCLIYYRWDLFNFLSNIFWHNKIILLILIYKTCVIMARELAKSLQW